MSATLLLNELGLRGQDKEQMMQEVLALQKKNAIHRKTHSIMEKMNSTRVSQEVSAHKNSSFQRISQSVISVPMANEAPTLRSSSSKKHHQVRQKMRNERWRRNSQGEPDISLLSPSGSMNRVPDDNTVRQDSQQS